MSGFVSADTKESIQDRAVWVNSQYENGNMSEQQAVAEIRDLKRRALALKDPVIPNPEPTISPKVVEIAGSSLLRQATLPGPAGWSVFQIFGGWGASILGFMIIIGIGVFILLAIREGIASAEQVATLAQGIGARTPRLYNPERDGISLAAAMSTVPVRAPQATRPIPSPQRSNRQLHSGEVPNNLI